MPLLEEFKIQNRSYVSVLQKIDLHQLPLTSLLPLPLISHSEKGFSQEKLMQN